MTEKERRQADAIQNRKLWDRGFRDGGEITEEEDIRYRLLNGAHTTPTEKDTRLGLDFRYLGRRMWDG